MEEESARDFLRRQHAVPGAALERAGFVRENDCWVLTKPYTGMRYVVWHEDTLPWNKPQAIKWILAVEYQPGFNRMWRRLRTMEFKTETDLLTHFRESTIGNGPGPGEDEL